MKRTRAALRKRLTRPITALVTASWIACLYVPAPAAAQGAKDAEILQLINAGQYAAATEVLNAQNPSDADRAFTEGRISKVQGNLPQAIQSFRRALQIDPTYIKARRELAHTLLLNRQYDVAEFHFKALLDSDPNKAMHDGYRRFLNIIDRNKPIGVSGYFALIPSTNVNRGTTQSVFDTASGTFVIDPDSKASSGVGTQLGVSGYFRHRTGPKSRVTLNWGLAGTRYEDKIHDNATGVVSLSYEQNFDAGRWYISPFFSSTWREDDADYDTRGARFGIARRLSGKNTLYVSGSHEYRRFLDQGYKSGGYNLASLGLGHQIDPSLSVNGGLAFEFNNARLPHLRYYGHKLFAGVSKSWQGGLQTSSSIEFGVRDFVGDFPFTTSPRDDSYYGISAAVSNTRIDIGGFTPRLSCSYRVNQSNVAFYDYDTTECLASLSKNF